MPIVKSIPIHTTVQKSLAYILNPDKTDDLLYTASLNCMTNAADAYYNMKMTYEHFSGHSFDAPLPEKGKGRVKAIHYIQSFSPDENITPEQAHRIAKAFVRKTFGDDCQAVIATYLDKDHVHSHIILNSYSLSGKKFYDNMKSRKQIRDYSDRVCLAFGIQPLQPKSKKTKSSSYAEWSNKQRGTSWKEKIRLEIDALLPTVKNVDELLAIMEERGYTIRRGKYYSVKAPGQKRAVRFENLGDVYSLKSLDIRIHYDVGKPVNYDENSKLQVAYNAVLGQVTQLAQRGQKVQRRRNSQLPYSPQNDLDVYRLSAQLTIITRDNLQSIGEVQAKMETFQNGYETARREINQLSVRLADMDKLAEQAEQYFSILNKSENQSDTDKLMISMSHENLARNNIHNQTDYVKLDADRKVLREQITALKVQHDKAHHYYEVYQDIVQTYQEISEGDYISRLINERKQAEERQNQTADKRRSR